MQLSFIATSLLFLSRNAAVRNINTSFLNCIYFFCPKSRNYDVLQKCKASGFVVLNIWHMQVIYCMVSTLSIFPSLVCILVFCFYFPKKICSRKNGKEVRNLYAT